MSSKNNKYDDLTIIKGVGKVRQAWFRDVFNVKTLQDLADLSVDEIESRLKNEGRIVSRSEVEQWIIQAQNLVTVETSKRPKETAMREVDDESNLPENGDHWEWLKAFVVEFCVFRTAVGTKNQEIRVYPLQISKGGDWLENGDSKKTPIKFTEHDKPMNWMLEQLDKEVWEKPKPKQAIPITPKPGQEPAETEPQFKLPSIEALPAVEIFQIRAYQPLNIDTPAIIGEAGFSFVGSVRGNNPFALEVEFAVSEKVTDEIARLVGYKADFYARRMNTKNRVLLGETTLDVLFIDRISYTARLPRVFLKPGYYYLGAQVKLRSQPPKVKYLEVPMFQVV